jgi:uncharacterized membrane protein YgcG
MTNSGVEVRPGNQQAQIDASTASSNGWYVLDNIGGADIYVEEANSEILPDCFNASGKSAADITIQVGSAVPSGMMAILPMTYRVSMGESELTSRVGASYASAVLSNPEAYLQYIFALLVIQKEIKQGGWEGNFTRLVDGVLTPEEAYGMGILNITGGSSLTLTLSYYLLDGPAGTGNHQEAFVRDGYLIVPDGYQDGVLRDQIWLSEWKDASGSLGTTEGASGGSSGGDSNNSIGSSGGGGGGGCDSGIGAAFLAAAVLASVRRKLR